MRVYGSPRAVAKGGRGLLALLLVTGMLGLPAFSAVASAGNACITPGLVPTGWWPGDGNTDDIIGGRDGALVGDATFAAGQVEQAFALDGAGDFGLTAVASAPEYLVQEVVEYLGKAGWEPKELVTLTENVKFSLPVELK